MRQMEPLDDLYREVVLDHHRHPRGAAPLARVDAEGCGYNASCGDEVRLQVQIEGGRVAGAHVDTRGCAISTASGSMLADAVRGRSLDEARDIAALFKRVMHGEDPPSETDLGDLEALTGVRQFPVRVKCALLPWVTLLDALLAREQGRRAGVDAAPTTTEEELDGSYGV